MTDQEAAAGIRMVLAAVAMHALLGRPDIRREGEVIDVELLVKKSVAIAEALMKEAG